MIIQRDEQIINPTTAPLRSYLFLPTYGDEASDIAGVLVHLDETLLAALTEAVDVARTVQEQLGGGLRFLPLTAPTNCYYVGHNYSEPYAAHAAYEVADVPTYQVQHIGGTPDTPYYLVQMTDEPTEATEWRVARPCGARLSRWRPGVLRRVRIL